MDIYKNKYPNLTFPADLVIQGKVINASLNGKSSGSFLVEVTRVLKGSYNKPEIGISGYGGIDCIRYASEFPVGTEWVFIIDASTAIPRIPACGEYALKIVGSHVESNNLEKYTKDKHKVRLNDLYESLGIINE